jgi:hypothetical protein
MADRWRQHLLTAYGLILSPLPESQASNSPCPWVPYEFVELEAQANFQPIT